MAFLSHDGARDTMKHYAVLISLLLTACAGGPPPAHWKSAAHAGLERYGQAWLTGESKRAEIALAETRQAVASTGRLDLAARVEISRCAYQTAALVFDCTALNAADANAEDRAYAAFLQGDFSRNNAERLAPHYRALVTAPHPEARVHASLAIANPASRLIAAAVLFRRHEANPALIANAIDTASAQGWRRPLLAWLKIAEQRALARGDSANATIFARRSALVGAPEATR
jgi:hypothetical protein